MQDKIFGVLAPSGSGKTAAGINLDPSTTLWICPENKALPFPGASKNYNTYVKKEIKPHQHTKWSLKSNFIPEDDMQELKNIIVELDELLLDAKAKGKKPPVERKVVLIDTLSYAMLRSVRNRAAEDNYSKFIVFFEEFMELIEVCKNVVSPIYFIITAHVDYLESAGPDKQIMKLMKVPAGKLTREKGEPEGLFTVLFYAEVIQNGEELSYKFRTQGGGGYPSKSPMGMFKNLYIDNDYQAIIERMNAYYIDGVVE